MKNFEKLVLIEFLGLIGVVVFVVGFLLWSSIVFVMVILFMEWGNIFVFVYGYSFYGIFFWSRGEIKVVFEFFEVIYRLFECFGGDIFKGLIVVNFYLCYWKEYLGKILFLFLECYFLVLFRGDLEFVSYNIFLYFFYFYFIGLELIEFFLKLNNVIDVVF